MPACCSPDTSDKLDDFQLVLLTDLAKLHHELLNARRSLYSFAKEYQVSWGDKPDIVMGHMVSAKMAIHSVAEDEARRWVQDLLQPRETAPGIHATCIVQWRLDEESMWRGPPDNARVLRLAGCIIKSGFRKDSCIISRTHNVSATAAQGEPNIVTFGLLFGNGSARGIAASVVWSLVLRRITEIPPKNCAVEHLITSLWAIPTMFELHGVGSDMAALVAQAVYQNQCQTGQPVSTLDWIGMVLKCANLPLRSTDPTSRAVLLGHFNLMMATYSKHPAVQAPKTERAGQVKKRRRKTSCGTRSVGMEGQDGDPDVNLMIGHQQICAMRSFLAGATPFGYAMLQEHLVLQPGDASVSVISDEVMMSKWFYVGSQPPQASKAARGSKARKSTAVPDGSTSALLRYNMPLSETQFNMMIEKAIAIFERDTSQISSAVVKEMRRPNKHAWLQYRAVVQHWDVAIAKVAKNDLGRKTFSLLEEQILRDRAMDDEVVGMLAKQPVLFHMQLLPGVQVADQPLDEDLQQAREGHFRSKLRVLQAEIQTDWTALTRMCEGHRQLAELCWWLELEQRRGQASTAERLVSNFMAPKFPVCEINAWHNLPGEICKMAHAWGSERRVIILIDFNTPYSRDRARLTEMISAIGTLAKVLGPSKTAVLAWMPNAPRESATLICPEEDEAYIREEFTCRGFCSQRRIRMPLNVPARAAGKTSELDWWADGRLLWQNAVDADNWVEHSELACIRRVRQEATLPHTTELVTIASPDPNEDFRQGVPPPDVCYKNAQRGPGTAEIQLAALLNKVPLSPLDETIVIDLIPYVGDRALGTYQMMSSAVMANRGTLRHVVVNMRGVPSFSKGAVFTQQRLKTRMTREWFSGTLVLHEAVLDNLGNVVDMEEPALPPTDIPLPTLDQLQRCPGAAHAHRGIEGMHFLACHVQGGKIKIQPDRLKEFNCAPVDVWSALNLIQTTHKACYEDVLQQINKTKTEPGKTGDGRHLKPETTAELVVYKSEKDLREATTIIAEARGGPKFNLLRDDKNSLYLVAHSGDAVLPVGTHLGGVGMGKLLPLESVESDERRCFRWSLPAGDKTWVQLTRTHHDDSNSKVPKLLGGTLYAIVRGLEMDTPSTGPPNMTAFGRLVPVGSPGQHEYLVEFPEDHESHHGVAFVLLERCGKGDSVRADNFFAPVLDRDTGVGPGALTVCWRILHDPVNNILKPMRPVVVTGKRIVLRKGCPARVTWPAPLSDGCGSGPSDGRPKGLPEIPQRPQQRAA